MAGNDCPSSIQFCMTRIARLASDGSTPAGATNGYITDKAVTLQISPQYDDGQEIQVDTGCGAVAIAYKDPDRLKRVLATLTMATVDAELEELIAGFTLITSGGQTVGSAAPAIGSTPPFGISLEGYSKGWIGGGAPPGQTFTDGVENTTTTLTSATAAFTQADVGRTITGTNIPAATTIASVTNGTTIIMSAAATATASGITFTLGRPGAYIRWAFPRLVLNRIGDLAFGNSALTPAYSGPGYENPGWGNGPFNDWPTGAVSGRAWARDRVSALPTSACGYATIPAQV